MWFVFLSPQRLRSHLTNCKISNEKLSCLNTKFNVQSHSSSKQDPIEFDSTNSDIEMISDSSSTNMHFNPINYSSQVFEVLKPISDVLPWVQKCLNSPTKAKKKLFQVIVVF